MAAQPLYYTYMLRFWSENAANGRTTWRYSLLDPQSGERLGFHSLAALVEYLAAVTTEIGKERNESED
ncbi:MAG: hypothetical protein GY796_18105 [Chloroflexi bacterium]|nr:hypothetical protein [Chloroflexota bacterium]